MIDALEQDLKQALLSRDQVTVNVLRMVKSALQNETIAKRGELDDQEQLRVLNKQAKQREEAATMYEKAGETERAQTERAELAVIAKYLPKQMSADELSKLVDDTIAKLSADGTPNKGAVIQAVMQAAAGQAPGGEVAKLVNERLAG